MTQFGQTLLSGNGGGAGLPYNLISGTPFPVWMKLYCQEHTKADSQGR